MVNHENERENWRQNQQKIEFFKEMIMNSIASYLFEKLKLRFNLTLWTISLLQQLHIMPHVDM